MPQPFDLASVAWLIGEGIGEWAMWDAYTRRHADRRDQDLAVVVRDQQRYIRELEAMVRPTLVQPIGEQEAML